MPAPIPVIDLFAGPGGLGEGFSAYPRDGGSAFDIRLSIEKDAQPHATLELRSFFRQFPRGRIPGQYYDFLRDVDVPPAVRRKRQAELDFRSADDTQLKQKSLQGQGQKTLQLATESRDSSPRMNTCLPDPYREDTD